MQHLFISKLFVLAIVYTNDLHIILRHSVIVCVNLPGRSSLKCCNSASYWRLKMSYLCYLSVICADWSLHFQHSVPDCTTIPNASVRAHRRWLEHTIFMITSCSKKQSFMSKCLLPNKQNKTTTTTNKIMIQVHYFKPFDVWKDKQIRKLKQTKTKKSPTTIQHHNTYMCL